MRCPHCGHSDVKEFDEERVYGEKEKTEDDKFYHLPITLERSTYYENDRVDMYGCPKCNKVFISKW